MNEIYEFLHESGLTIKVRVTQTSPPTELHAVLALKGKRGLIYKESGSAKTYEKCIGVGHNINSCIADLFNKATGNTLIFKVKDTDTLIKCPRFTHIDIEG